MKTNTPATYNSITQVYGGSGALTGYTLPPHRAVMFSASGAISAGITYQNIDGTTGSLVMGAGVFVIPTQIYKIWLTGSSSLRVHSLV